MLGVWFDPSQSVMSGLEAEVVLGGQGRPRPALRTSVAAVGRRGMVLEGVEGLRGASHAWVSVELPSGERVRPLVELGAENEGRFPVRFRHLFPRDAAALEAYHASRASASGY